MNKLLTIIVPCYNEENNINKLYKAICEYDSFFSKNKLNIEFIFIDDGSKDDTANKVWELHTLDPRVNLIEFSRNFGKESAMYAGLLEAKGDFVSIMDADMQDPPSLLPKMIETILSGTCDCVATRRINRKGEPIIRSFFAKRFYNIMNKISDIKLVSGARDFRIMTREMTDAVLQLSEKNRFLKGIFAWVGFKTTWIEYENVERNSGSTKWSFANLLAYATDGLIAFSAKPLALTSFCGLLFCLISLILVLVIIIRTLIFGDPVNGWPSLACIIFFVSGIQLFCQGVLGLYLSNNYTESKNRPIFIKKKPRE